MREARHVEANDAIVYSQNLLLLLFNISSFVAVRSSNGRTEQQGSGSHLYGTEAN
jgi:hypothetical protein